MAGNDRRIPHAQDSWIIRAEKRKAGAVASDAHGEVDVPGHLREPSTDRLVSVIVLPARVAVTVPIAHRVLDREDAHPLLDIGDRIKGRRVRDRGRVRSPGGTKGAVRAD